MTDAWAAVMRELRGRRLAIYARANERSISQVPEQDQADVAWLQAHYFLHEPFPGILHARPHMEAALLYAANPPKCNAASVTFSSTSAAKSEADMVAINTPDRSVRVHTHQLSFL